MDATSALICMHNWESVLNFCVFLRAVLKKVLSNLFFFFLLLQVYCQIDEPRPL